MRLKQTLWGFLLLCVWGYSWALPGFTEETPKAAPENELTTPEQNALDAILMQQSKIETLSAPKREALQAKMAEVEAYNQRVRVHNTHCEKKPPSRKAALACNSESDRLDAQAKTLQDERNRLMGELTVFKNRWEVLEGKKRELIDHQ